MASKKAKSVSMGKLEGIVSEGFVPVIQFGYASKGKKYTYSGAVIACDADAGSLTMIRRSHITQELSYRSCNHENMWGDIIMVNCFNSEDEARKNL